MNRSAFTDALSSRGWVGFNADRCDKEGILAEMRELALELGRPVHGRRGRYEESISPHTTFRAHPRSLSAKYGLDELPFHVELSHRLTPCRYLLLGCIDPGSSTVPTTLLNWHNLNFSKDELNVLESAPILVRNGRRSFYSSILPRNRAYFRYDPGCLEPVDARGTEALALVARQLSNAHCEHHYWERGKILVIDNWRFLHGRGTANGSTGRCLARIMVND